MPATIALAVAVAVAMVVVVVAVGVAAWEHAHRPRVLLVGDSITYVSRDELAHRLDGRYRVDISGAPGKRADQRIHDLPLLVATKPKAVVVNLGTNDLLQDRPPSVAVAAIERIGESFPTARCVVLVTVSQDIYNTRTNSIETSSVELDRLIRATAERHHWLVVPWDTLVRQYLAAHQPEGSLTIDTVHPLSIGRKLLADAYAVALGHCPRL